MILYKIIILIHTNQSNDQFQRKVIVVLVINYLVLISKSMIKVILIAVFAAIVTASPFPDGFDYLSNIDKSIIISARYATRGNFVGEIIDGYKAPTVVISKEAGMALRNVQQDLIKYGYNLVVYDAYRPQKAVDHFIRWSQSPQDYRTKQQFYPYINKEDIIPMGYVAKKSGHSRGSTVDLTIIPLGQKLHQIQLFKTKLTNGQEITYRDDGSEFMCSHFDYFGQPSHHDTNSVTIECLNRRNLLKNIMIGNNFKPLSEQWWHYTLKNEPFPNTYFDFDII